MCGIVGYVGNKNIKETLLNMLKFVEYRGYDSAGLAYINNDKIIVKKTVGDIKALKEKVGKDTSNTLGIAHTRWATHGKVNLVNAHPHLSEDKSWAIVHNGIIENYLDIKKELISKFNIKFKSETDSEIIAQLLKVSNLKGVNALKFVCDKLKGSYAIAVINKVDNKILLARRESPLYISHNNGESFIASDPICFKDYSKSYLTLNNGEFACVTKDKVIIYNNDLQEISRQTQKIDFFDDDGELGNYNHFMEKEISQTPNIINNLQKAYKESNIFEKIDKHLLKNIEEIILIGCGTAYHACLMGEAFFEKIAKIKAHSYIASEFRYYNRIIGDKTLFIFVSQSGETADTLGALEIAKKHNAKTVALTNVLYSTLAKNSNYILPVYAKTELAVASTKAYTAQITILNMFAKYLLSIKKNLKYDNKIIEYKSLYSNFQNEINTLSTEILKYENIFFLGRDLDYVTASEASLKLKEITYMNSSAYPCGELKHGFLALVSNTSLVFVIATQKKLLDKVLNSANEAKSRGAKIVLISQLDITKEQKNNLYMHIKLNHHEEDLMPIYSIEFFQWLAYKTSCKKGINPDKPRNLAKSVTVE